MTDTIHAETEWRTRNNQRKQVPRQNIHHKADGIPHSLIMVGKRESSTWSLFNVIKKNETKNRVQAENYAPQLTNQSYLNVISITEMALPKVGTLDCNL
jgi:hypothetical protein